MTESGGSPSSSPYPIFAVGYGNPQGFIPRACARGHSTPLLASRRRRRSPQPPVEELDGRVIRAEPVRVREEVVHFVGEHELLDRDALLAERRRELDRLAELYVAVVVPVDQEHGRTPGLHRGHG